MKKYLPWFIILSLIFVSLPTLAEIDTKENLALKRKAKIERLRKKAEESRVKSGKPKLVEFLSLSVEDPLKNKYLEMVLQRLNEIGNEYYPEEIVELKEPQVIIVSFSLGRTGNLVNAHIIKSSKHKVINDYMLRVLKVGQPFPSYVNGAFSDTIEKVVITKAIHFNNVGANAYSN